MPCGIVNDAMPGSLEAEAQRSLKSDWGSGWLEPQRENPMTEMHPSVSAVGAHLDREVEALAQGQSGSTSVMRQKSSTTSEARVKRSKSRPISADE
jgi:hypothetical protein